MIKSTFTLESLHGCHHAELLLGGEFLTCFGQVEVGLIIGGEGFADFVGHEHVPLVQGFVDIGYDKAILLELVEGLASLADSIVIGTCFYKFIDYLEFLLVQSVKYIFRIV